MAVLKGQGVTVTELSELFGFNPQTVRRHLSDVRGAELDAVRQVVSAELFAMNRLTQKKYLVALLERDPNRLATDREGEPIKGAYVVSEKDLAGIIEKTLAAMGGLAAPAGLGQSGESGGSVLQSWALNDDRMARVLSTLPAGSRVRIHQEVEVSSGGVSGESPEAVEAPFSVEGP